MEEENISDFRGLADVELDPVGDGLLLGNVKDVGVGIGNNLGFIIMYLL